MNAHSPKPPPVDRRPYRGQHETGTEMRTVTASADQVWRQIGWHGQSGAFYSLGEDPSFHEPGSFSPLWLLVDNEPPVIDEGT